MKMESGSGIGCVLWSSISTENKGFFFKNYKKKIQQHRSQKHQKDFHLKNHCSTSRRPRRRPLIVNCHYVSWMKNEICCRRCAMLRKCTYQDFSRFFSVKRNSIEKWSFNLRTWAFGCWMQFLINDKCHQWCLWPQWTPHNVLKLWARPDRYLTNARTSRIRKPFPSKFPTFSACPWQVWIKWSSGKNWLICHACVTQVWWVQRSAILDLRPRRTRSPFGSGGDWPPLVSSIPEELCPLWPQRTRKEKIRPRSLFCHATKSTRREGAYQLQRSCRRPEN